MSQPAPPAPPGTRTDPGGTAGLIAKVAVGTAVGGIVSAFLAASIAINTDRTDVGLWVRGLVGLLVVALICRHFGRRAQSTGVGRPAPPVLLVGAGAFLGFLLDPLTWQARTGFTQVWVEPGPITLTADLLVWMLVATAGAALGARSAPPRSPATTPYG